MTHDELLAKINGAIKIHNELVGVPLYLNALRAVVELHKPVIYINLRGAECQDCDGLYPCKTIQAIEKELK